MPKLLVQVESQEMSFSISIDFQTESQISLLKILGKTWNLSRSVTFPGTTTSILNTNTNPLVFSDNIFLFKLNLDKNQHSSMKVNFGF